MYHCTNKSYMGVMGTEYIDNWIVCSTAYSVKETTKLHIAYHRRLNCV